MRETPSRKSNQTIERIGLTLVTFLLASSVRAGDPAIIEMRSHGVSATIINSIPGCSYILLCAHGHEGQDRNKPMSVSIPADVPSKQKVGITLIAVDYRRDLVLCKLNAGPFATIPVAAVGPKVGDTVVTAGYDGMRNNGPDSDFTSVTTTVVGIEGTRTLTRARPRPGRSGGPLLFKNQLVGTCTGYSDVGIYCSHASILAFLKEHGYEGLIGNPGTPPTLIANAPPPAPLSQNGRWVWVPNDAPSQPAPLPPATVVWRNDLQTAKAESLQTGKPLLIFFKSEHCAPCLRMERETLADARVAQTLNERYIPVYGDESTANWYNIAAYPAIMVGRPNEALDVSKGFVSADEMMNLLRAGKVQEARPQQKPIVALPAPRMPAPRVQEQPQYSQPPMQRAMPSPGGC